MGQQLVIIKTLEQLEALQVYLEDKDYVSFDCETTGVEIDSEIIGFSVCADVEVGFYCILAYWDVVQKKLAYLETKQGAKAFLEKLIGKSLIMQNAGFDCSMVKSNFQVELMPSVHTDTLVLGHLLNENRSNGLKERGVELYGEDARKEQEEMKASVYANGGVLTKECYELYKADADLIAHYGAKDAILTLKIFYNDVPELYEQGLEKFFYEEESMPLLRGPTYDLNTSGLRVDPVRLQNLKKELEGDILQAKAYIHKEIEPYVKEKYKGTSAKNTFNIGASQQLAWLLYFKLGNEFNTLTKGGKELCKALDMKLPYSIGAKKEFLRVVRENFGRTYMESKYNPKTKKMARPKKVGDPWKYLACGKESIGKFSSKYKWAARLLEYAKNKKLLNTYVEGIESRMRYNIIRPNFLQHGTTSGRYSCKKPNFQNLPRDDKRVKSCIIARTGKVFVGADYSQLEPRVFASYSQDARLLNCFKVGDDFYSVVGVDIAGVVVKSLKKSGEGSFAELYPKERQDAKPVSLGAVYGQTAAKLSVQLGVSMERAQEIIDAYFEKFPAVKSFMLKQHALAKANGYVTSLFGRLRRLPKALEIKKVYGNTKHCDLPYEIRTILNLAVNHPIQSTGASIINRAAIAVHRSIQARTKVDPRWLEAHLVLQVHDELILEVPEELAEEAAQGLKHSMESAGDLPGVALKAEPKIAKDLASLK